MSRRARLRLRGGDGACRVRPRAALVFGVSFLCLVAGAQGEALAFPNAQPDAALQWYLTQDDAWSAWPAPPKLVTVKVAVIDSGIDAGNPAFVGRIDAGKSFVGGSWRVDSDGHGTFIAGIIAANSFNGIGTAGIAFNSKLLIAKVVEPDGVIPPGAEVNAIRWAVREGARVINISFGGLRDPDDLEFDWYSASERAAVEDAYAKGAVIVAAAGNGTNAPKQPWPFADYPAALPNVLSVAALNKNGTVPAFSNRDARRVDIAAPGAGIFSTIPRNLEDAAHDPGCAGDPYSNCGPPEYRTGDGTSFAAPQVAAAAALLLGVDPALAPDQVDWILERSATPTGHACARCGVEHNALTGFGRLDIARAVAFLRDGVALPPPDTLEPDDDTGAQSHPLSSLPATISGSEDYWDDPVDVFTLALRPGEKLAASLLTLGGTPMLLRLWRPHTPDLQSAPPSDVLATSSATKHDQQRLSYEACAGGFYALEVIDSAPSRARARYQLALSATTVVAEAGAMAPRRGPRDVPGCGA